MTQPSKWVLVWTHLKHFLEVSRNGIHQSPVDLAPFLETEAYSPLWVTCHVVWVVCGRDGALTALQKLLDSATEANGPLVLGIVN